MHKNTNNTPRILISQKTIKNIFQYILSLIILLIIWKLIVVFFSLKEYILPPPENVIKILFNESELFYEATIYTFKNVVIGGTLGISVGILLAIILAYNKTLRIIIEPYLIIFQSFPKESLFPLFVIWLGFGAGPKIMNSFLMTFLPVVVIVLNSLINIDKKYLKLFKSWHSTKLQIFLYGRIPFAIPEIISAIKIGLPLALVGVVLGEFMGGSRGLGYLIISSGTQFRVDRIFASILILSAIGVLFLVIIQIVQKIFLKKYYN